MAAVLTYGPLAIVIIEIATAIKKFIKA